MLSAIRIITFSLILICYSFKTGLANIDYSKKSLSLINTISSKHIDQEPQSAEKGKPLSSINNKFKTAFYKKHWVQSLLIPGLGQASNKKYWKIPIIYAGFAGLTYAIIWNRGYYNTMINEYKARTENNPNFHPNPIYDNIPVNQFLSAANYYRRNETLSIILAVTLYGLQIIDALVDQELSQFQINDDLSLKISPYFNNHSYQVNNAISNRLQYGLSLNLYIH